MGEHDFGIKYVKFIAAKQEFNTPTYGIKGNIDSTIIIEDALGNQKQTALEIKTGKRKPASYRGQVILYSLLISERFLRANPETFCCILWTTTSRMGSCTSSKPRTNSTCW